MFEKFAEKFHITSQTLPATSREGTFHQLERVTGFADFMGRYEGATFNQGIYRIHTSANRRKWSAIIEEAYSLEKGAVSCFAYDWLGRQFALDGTRRVHGEPLLLLLEIGTGQALRIPLTFADFHEKELVEDPDAALLPAFFQEWMDRGHNPLKPDECVGYKTPLFLGGADEIENFEVTNMDVYWGLLAQLLAQVRNQPEGASIKSSK